MICFGVYHTTTKLRLDNRKLFRCPSCKVSLCFLFWNKDDTWSIVLYVLGHGNCLEHVRGFACILFYILFCVKFRMCYFTSCGPYGWNKTINNQSIWVDNKSFTKNEETSRPKHLKEVLKKEGPRQVSRSPLPKLITSLYEGAWSAKTVVLTSIKIAENASRSSAATTHC